MLPSYAARRRSLPVRASSRPWPGVPRAVPGVLPGLVIERAVDQPPGRLVAAQVPVLRVAEHDGYDDLWLLGRGISHEPRVLHVERLGPGQRAGLAGDADRLAPPERSRRAAELAGRLHHPADRAGDLAGH